MDGEQATGTEYGAPTSTAQSVLERFPIDRIRDNRLKGLLREVSEALADCDDPEALRDAGQSLKMLGDQARSAAYSKTGLHW